MPDPVRPPDGGRTEPGGTRLRKWYFCANTAAMRGRVFKLLRAAVHSCLRHTDLQPVCLYHGERAPALRVLRELGVTVIRHRPTLEDALRPAYGDAYEAFAGHWLRVDIPQVEEEEEFVLYTDIDVLFRSLPPTLAAPELLAVAPERWRTQRHPFNSGVMLMNLPALREVDGDFRAAIHARLKGDFTYPTHDQASFNAFFEGRADPLPLAMNWKPYWGIDPGAHIVHFHGPKPSLVDHVARKGMVGVRDEQGYLFDLNRRAHRHYAALYRAELDDRPDPAHRPAAPSFVVPGPAHAPSALGDAVLWTADQARHQATRLRRRLTRRQG